MINPVNSINEIVQQAAQGDAGHGHHPVATVGASSPSLVQADVIALSQQALNGLLNEDLALAFNAAAPDAAVKVTPPVPTTLVNQIQTAAQNVSGNPDFFSYLVNALGGPHYVAALMAAQQASEPSEPLTGSISPVSSSQPTLKRPD